jgi:BirA family biotin operon repressor/biotin-[acetyl-CoA-carboxylase] ligase
MALTWDVHRFESIDSTNTWVVDRARAGAPEGLVAVADYQTAGRGRLGRTWEAPPGANLLCTVLLRPALMSHLVVACVALAARDAALSVAGVSCGLKWPNDLMVGDGWTEKLAGILAEVDGVTGGVAVGIGMNVAWAPPGAGRLGEDVSRDEVLTAMLSSLEGWYGAGWPVVARAYRESCVTLNREVRVELADETFTGRAADVDDDGHLLVDVGVCLRTVSAGDVVHLR